MESSAATIDASDVKLTKQAAKGGAIGLVGLLVGQVVTLALHLLLTRVLGASLYGIYALGQSVSNVNRALLSVGVAQAVVRYGAMYSGQGDRSRFKGTVILGFLCAGILNVFLGLFVFLLADVIAIRFFKEAELTPVLRMIAFAFPLFAMVNVAAASSRALKRVGNAVGVQRVFQPVANLVFAGLAFLLGYRLLGAVGGFLLSLLVSAVLGVWLLIRAFPDLVSSLAPTFESRTFILFAASLFVVGLSGNLLSQTDRFVLGYFLPAEQVGIYSAAAVVALRASIALGAVGLIFEPIISDLYHRNEMERLGKVFKTVTRWVVSLTLPICIVFVLFSREIMMLFRPEFASGYGILIVLTIGEFVNAGVGRVGSMLTMTGNQKVELVNRVLAVGLIVSLGVVLVPRYGVMGAAIATSLAVALVNIGRLLEVYHLLHIQPYQISYWKPIGAGLMSVVFGLWLKSLPLSQSWLWMAQAAAVGAFFVVVLVIVLGIDSEDKAVLAAARRKLALGAGRT